MMTLSVKILIVAITVAAIVYVLRTIFGMVAGIFFAKKIAEASKQLDGFNLKVE